MEFENKIIISTKSHLPNIIKQAIEEVQQILSKDDETEIVEILIRYKCKTKDDPVESDI